MAAATQLLPQPISYEEYMHTAYDPDCEFVDGYLEERIVGDPKHGLIQMQIGIWFYLHPEWNLRAISELRTRTQTTRVRLPDVAIVEDDGLLMQYPRTNPPFIAIEVLSPDDRLNRTIPRLKEFLAMGVQHVWLLNPMEQAGYVFTATGLTLVETQVLTIEGSPVHLDLNHIFQALNVRRN